MTAACDCPVVPDLSELQAPALELIIGAPLKCLSCGHELELRCPEGHVHQAPRTTSPNIRPAVKALPPEKPRGRTCPDCGSALLPRKQVCRVCHPDKPVGTNSARVYSPKACACGRTFIPSGPRSVRCDVCRGIS